MNERIMKRIKETIYFLLRFNNKPLDDELKEKYDGLLEKMINEKFEYNEEDFRVIHLDGFLESIGDKSLPIALEFYATIQDNIELMNKMNEAGYTFFTSGSKINLYALDKKFSSKFDTDDYIKLLKNTEHSVKRFYNSLVFVPEEEKEQYMSDFAEIIKHKPNITKNREDSDIYGSYLNILTARNIRCFGKEFLMNLTEQQKIVLNSLTFNLDDRHVKIIKDLLTKYPNKVFNVTLRKDILDNFTIDEIASMSVKDATLYEFALKIGQLDKMKEVLKINPNFDCSRKLISPEIFKTVDAKDLAELTSIGMDELANIRIPKNELAYVIPVRKINRTVERDKKRRLKENKEQRVFFKKK